MNPFVAALFGTALVVYSELSAQNRVNDTPEFSLSKTEAEAHMRFLASDEMEGRRTGEQSNRVAARYIAEQFRKQGVAPVPGQSDYFQPIWFEKTNAAGKGILIAGADTLISPTHWLLMSGGDLEVNAPLVYAGYGLEDPSKEWDDYKGLDVRGKIVLVQSGFPESQSPRENMAAAAVKRKLAAEKGAVALVELYNATTPWNIIGNFLSREQIGLAETTAGTDSGLPHIWVDGKEPRLTRLLRDSPSLTIRSEGRPTRLLRSYNVAGYIEGSDPGLKSEYILLTAHYDHVGVGPQGGQPYTETDSIFNGARDNAFGTIAVLSAAEALVRQKPRRSVLLVAFTGEELGLLGSRYYANNPLLPLNKCIFNLNVDGAGYNDTSILSVLGFKRTGASAEIETAARHFGLGVVGDPAPEQNLFDRSDNVNFAVKGIPAPTFSPGFREFDAEIMKYYHQATDNPETIDFDYLLKFCKAYVHAARLIADRAQPPQWEAGDKYEPAAKALYGK